MSNFDIICAWKDEEYRNSLSDEQRSQLPENPAGMIELTNELTQTIAGGKFTQGIICTCRLTHFTCGTICDIQQL
ncbi:mersacidin/lichenicidin family type 2 lantibiotic [Aliinostoc sp. HNIBRCY26]|uniref:mersacidin/lichenicidin family type 2 lantibiotic n=1 Tax=Aliinostoc sp. HNIBRCY26 TaxID=3418997 RepID=UPI003CFCE0D2